MLYLGIDQHSKQLTVDCCDERGHLVLHRQVSTQWQALEKFFGQMEALGRKAGGWMAIVEVCGFNDYLLKLLKEYGCGEIILVQPETRGRKKTDRRDARNLRELLWVNRHCLDSRRPLAKLRRVAIVSAEEASQRQLTAMRKRVTVTRTRTINRVYRVLHKHNLQHGCPTKGKQTLKARAWLKQLELPEVDRLEMDHLLSQWTLCEEQLKELDQRIQEHHAKSRSAQLLRTTPGLSTYGSLAVASRVGPIDRFPRATSLANFFGLTPGCHNSGETQRLGSITKQGSSMVRYILGQAVLHVLRADAWMRQWYRRIKRRRGSKIARVAVMRRLATIIWAMLKYDMPYVVGGPQAVAKAITARERVSSAAAKGRAAGSGRCTA